MDFSLAFWHLLNFFAPGLGLGLIASALTKLLWRRELQQIGWLRLASWAVVGCSLVSIAGLASFGRDGKIATWAAMVAVCALTLWLFGFGPLRRRRPDARATPARR